MTAPTATCTGDALIAEVLLRASPAAVWRALTDPRQLARWWGSPDSYQADEWELDLRVGGRWIARGKSTDGSPFHVGGEILEVVSEQRLAMTWEPSFFPGPPTRIVYELTSEPGGTRLRLNHSGFESEQDRDGHADGWKRVLGWLAGHVDRQAGGA